MWGVFSGIGYFKHITSDSFLPKSRANEKRELQLLFLYTSLHLPPHPSRVKALKAKKAILKVSTPRGRLYRGCPTAQDPTPFRAKVQLRETCRIARSASCFSSREVHREEDGRQNHALIKDAQASKQGVKKPMFRNEKKDIRPALTTSHWVPSTKVLSTHVTGPECNTFFPLGKWER